MAAAGPNQRPAGSCAATFLVFPVLVASLLVSFIIQVAVALLSWPLLLGCRDRFHHIQSFIFRGIQSALSVCLNPFWQCDLYMLGDAPGPPRGGKGSIIFVNHRSNADAWFSSWLLTRSCIEGRYVYKSSLNSVPILGWCMMLAGDLSVSFSDKSKVKSMMQRARDLVENGYHIVVFPEGTRSPSGILQEFKPGFLRLCAETGCAAVPVCMMGTELAWPLNGLRVGCAKVVCGIGDPLFAESGADWQPLAVAVETSFRSMAKELAEEVGEDRCDPLITDRPYPYWTPPASLVELAPEEQMRLLRTGQTHERGARLV